MNEYFLEQVGQQYEYEEWCGIPPRGAELIKYGSEGWKFAWKDGPPESEIFVFMRRKQ